MDALVIGRPPPSGRVTVSGARTLPCHHGGDAAHPGVHKLRNVPDLRDTRTFAAVLTQLGARVTSTGTCARRHDAELGRGPASW
jgi:UDP-N-acetylglucosamine enolpyruvyl transferase